MSKLLDTADFSQGECGGTSGNLSPNALILLVFPPCPRPTFEQSGQSGRACNLWEIEDRNVTKLPPRSTSIPRFFKHRLSLFRNNELKTKTERKREKHKGETWSSFKDFHYCTNNSRRCSRKIFCCHRETRARHSCSSLLLSFSCSCCSASKRQQSLKRRRRQGSKRWGIHSLCGSLRSLLARKSSTLESLVMTSFGVEMKAL